MHDNDISEVLQSRVLNALESAQTLKIVGGDSKAFYGNPVDANQTLELSPHQGIIAYEPTELVVTVRAGTPLVALENLLAENGQMIPFDPPNFNGQATIGGAVASGLSGPRRPYTGSARDALLGVKIINGQGQIPQFGGQVMKNVAGYDLSRLMSGAMGTLGVLLEVSFKLRPLPACEKTLRWKMDRGSALQQLRLWHRDPSNFSASAYDGKHLYLRISGDEQSVDKTIRSMDGMQLSQHEDFWRELKNHQHPWFETEQSIWRISTKPSVPLSLPDGDYLLEWAGGIRWLKTDLRAEIIRETVAKQGGHATLFSAGSNENTAKEERFQPLNSALFQLHKNVKHSLDPKGIFNPGRLYQEL